MTKHLTPIDHHAGLRIGGIPVFTHAGAVRAYQLFAARCYRDLTMESSIALSNEADKLHAMGYTPDDTEAMEISAIQHSS